MGSKPSPFPSSFILNKSRSHIKTANCIKFYTRHFTVSHVETAISSFLSWPTPEQTSLNQLSGKTSFKEIWDIGCVKLMLRTHRTNLQAYTNSKSQNFPQRWNSKTWYSFLPLCWNIKNWGVSTTSDYLMFTQSLNSKTLVKPGYPHFPKWSRSESSN